MRSERLLSVRVERIVECLVCRLRRTAPLSQLQGPPREPTDTVPLQTILGLRTSDLTLKAYEALIIRSRCARHNEVLGEINIEGC